MGLDQKLIILQPYLMPYRLSVYKELAQWYQVTIFSSLLDEKSNNKICLDDSGIAECRYFPMLDFLGGRLKYQKGMLMAVIRSRPDKVFAAADPRLINYWLILIYCFMFRIPFFSHGHGVYRKPNPSYAYKLMYRLMVKISDCYVAYTEMSKESMAKIGAADEKMKVVENTLICSSTVQPKEKHGDEQGVLFLGRLREGCQLDLMLSVVEELRKSHDHCEHLEIHVIGDGEERQRLLTAGYDLDFVNWHGEVYDEDVISEISKKCFVGCYPGNVGLSLVHMMSLSLPVLVNDDVCFHGPEHSYLRDGVNGLLFERSDQHNSLKAKLIEARCSGEWLKSAQMNAYETYRSLSVPSYGEKIKVVLEQA